jgi:hypothetical protein
METIIDTKKVKAVVKTGEKKGQGIYATQVLGVNRALKVETRSLGGCIKTLLNFSNEIGLDAQRVKVLRFVQKDNEAFKSFKGIVRISKAGNYSPFYVLQALNKNLANSTKEDAKKVTAKKESVKVTA